MLRWFDGNALPTKKPKHLWCLWKGTLYMILRPQRDNFYLGQRKLLMYFWEFPNMKLHFKSIWMPVVAYSRNLESLRILGTWSTREVGDWQQHSVGEAENFGLAGNWGRLGRWGRIRGIQKFKSSHVAFLFFEDCRCQPEIPGEIES